MSKRGMTVMRAVRVALALALVGAMLLPLARAEGDGFYVLEGMAAAEAGETVHLTLEKTYYSGDTIYKGSTGKPLNGSCALHCAAVVISNLRGEEVTGQRVAAANNRDIRQEKSWTPFVSWGKVAGQFGVGIRTENMAQYSANLKRRGVKTSERRERKMARLAEILDASAPDGGLIVHFNSSGQMNGNGSHRHAVVLIGYITAGDRIVDLLVNDSSLPAPEGVCVRMSRSSLPESILGRKRTEKALHSGDSLAMILMDYAVSCRWVIKEE